MTTALFFMHVKGMCVCVCVCVCVCARVCVCLGLCQTNQIASSMINLFFVSQSNSCFLHGIIQGQTRALAMN